MHNLTIKKTILGMILLLLPSTIIAMSRFTYDEYTPRGILFFLDDTESLNMGIVSGSLFTAIAQNAGPIIASATILRTIFLDYNPKRFSSESAQELERTFSNQMIQQQLESKPFMTDEMRYILLHAMDFKPNQWLIKEINKDLFILLPHNYLQQNNISIDSAKQFIDDPQNLTDTELQLGLKINHMKNTDFTVLTKQPEIIDIFTPVGPKPNYFIDALYDVYSEQSLIFCTRSDYREHQHIHQSLWSIYMNGHGTLNIEIVGIELQAFKNALNFFEEKITTQLLMYSSCYAAGLTNERVFKDSQNALETTYSFAIITHAITEAPTSEHPLNVEIKSGKLQLILPENFTQFFKLAHTQETMNYEKIGSSIFPALPRKGPLGSISWGNVPQIKLPGIEWFSVLASPKDIVSIGSILSQTRTEPLNIVTFFNTDPQALLLRSSNIPFELIINSNNLEAIISMIPGEAFHTIERISSDTQTIPEILEWFMKIQGLDTDKAFYIKEIYSSKDITTINDVIIYYDTISLFIGEKHICEALFKKDDTVYIKTPSKLSKQADNKQVQKYQSYLRQFQQPPSDKPSEFSFEHAQELEKILSKKNKQRPQQNVPTPQPRQPTTSSMQTIRDALKAFSVDLTTLATEL